MPWLRVLPLVLLFACGNDAGGQGDDDPTGDAGAGGDDGGGSNIDAGPPAGCDPLGPQCNNCVDDDDDGQIDGGDTECTGPEDDREDTFATGIPGDNVDPILQDCFFDGNSGEGEDGCFRPTCCLTEGDTDTCPPPGPSTTCEVSDECEAFCEPLTPPGCDCFGCCTVCNDTDCYDIAVGLAGDGCTAENLEDEVACPRCVKSTDCDGGDCDLEECILCPGQTEDDLPDTCDEQTCPGGEPSCDGNADCATDEFCSNGCCIGVVE
jgi:hypothetical protein